MLLPTMKAFGVDAWHEQVGIGVHVHRISNMLKWAKTSQSDKTEIEIPKVFTK
ncbi:alpha,alpha-trehalase nth1 [Tritrichomonas musculus]|uniref:Alpha,alpha-trehalase nth1 n=1 Tax=Tritrichomonas musculus TaxID=1915356 RepID=A0ABR2KQX7_9EUKA